MTSRCITRTKVEIDEVTVEFDPNRQRVVIFNGETQERLTLNSWQAVRVLCALRFINPGDYDDADS